MLQNSHAFSGFSVDRLEVAQKFYGDTLGLNIESQPGMGFQLKFPSGHTVFVYDKPNHLPAEFTILNFPVDDIDAAVQELGSKGVQFERYEGLQQDEKNIARGKAAGMGPDIAWFKDPAGNILSVLQN